MVIIVKNLHFLLFCLEVETFYDGSRIFVMDDPLMSAWLDLYGIDELLVKKLLVPFWVAVDLKHMRAHVL